MSNQTTTKGIQVLADLTLSNSHGDIKVDNDSEGQLIVNFPNQKSFFSILSLKLPFRSSWKSISRANQALYRNSQPIIIKVDKQPWVILGKFSRPKISYRKVAYPYVSETPSLKIAFYVLGSTLGATLLYILFRKRN